MCQISFVEIHIPYILYILNKGICSRYVQILFIFVKVQTIYFSLIKQIFLHRYYI